MLKRNSSQAGLKDNKSGPAIKKGNMMLEPTGHASEIHSMGNSLILLVPDTNLPTALRWMEGLVEMTSMDESGPIFNYPEVKAAQRWPGSSIVELKDCHNKSQAVVALFHAGIISDQHAKSIDPSFKVTGAEPNAPSPS